MDDIPLPHAYSQQHSTLLNNLKQFYSDGVLCDVILKAGNINVSCHRAVLAASSPYFRAMFTNEMTEKFQQTVSLHLVEESTFSKIIEYMYTSVICINNDNVQSIFTTANLLQMNDLCELCSNHMQQEIHLSNCVNLFRFASFHHAVSLKAVSKTFIINHFKEINTSDDFLSLEADELMEILKEDNLNVDDEVIVFNTAMNWFNTDFENRKEHVDKVLRTVRFGLIEEDLVDSLIASLECFKNGAILSKCLIDINKEYDEGAVTCRLGMFEREMIVFAGGSQTKNTRSLACFDPATKRNYYAVQPYLSFDFKYRIDHHRVVTTDNNEIFLIGGIYYDVYHYEEIGPALTEVKTFEPHKKMWENKASLLRPRCAHAVVIQNNKIYAFGGKSHYPRGEALNSCEVYDIEHNTWETIASMPIGLAHHGAAIHKSFAYVIGGYKNNENDEVSCDIYQYNTELDHWTELEAKLQIPRAEFGSVLLHEDIYIIAGDRGQYKINFVEVLNLKTLRMRFVADFPEDRKAMAAVILHNNIYVCGGVRTIISRMNRGPRVVETRDLWRYDPETDIWTKEAKLVQYANIHGCSVAKMNLRRLYESEFISSV